MDSMQQLTLLDGPVPLDYYTSPLRYPGGKRRAVKLILPHIPMNIKNLCSPFFGGGSIELACLSRGMGVVGYDKFMPLVNFWQQFLKNPIEIYNRVKKHYPLSWEEHYRLRGIYNDIESLQEKATVFFVLNKTSFSGKTFCGMSIKKNNFTKSAIEKLKSYKIKNLSIECLDFEKSILKNEDKFLYLDPPYCLPPEKCNLYGRTGQLHKNFKHEKLRDILRGRGQWLLSYNDCPEIRDLYRGYFFKKLQWPYSIGKNKTSNEVLIFSKDLKC